MDSNFRYRRRRPTTRRDRCRKKGVRIRQLLVFAALGREWWARRRSVLSVSTPGNGQQEGRLAPIGRLLGAVCFEPDASRARLRFKAVMRSMTGGRSRRVSPVPPRPREGPLTEPITGAQPRSQERVVVPHTRPWPTRAVSRRRGELPSRFARPTLPELQKRSLPHRSGDLRHVYSRLPLAARRLERYRPPSGSCGSSEARITAWT